VAARHVRQSRVPSILVSLHARERF
jgi:hypothetical protein